ncbi:hypothetical protein [Staphylococcus warneri]|uniref:hypothetical protein n=1 Tax=Staphylococcus warneri TaxID=1292 RepID=UPI0034CF28E1
MGGSGKRFEVIMEIKHYKDSLKPVTEDESNNSGGHIKSETKYFKGDITDNTGFVNKIVEFTKHSQNRRLKITSDKLENFIVEN